MWEEYVTGVPNVPTRVGVNRTSSKRLIGRSECPHACGGEPAAETVMKVLDENVPTRVGVNRSARRTPCPS